jgi:hypothetical protein
MCKRSEGKTCTSKHIVDKMWKQWQIKGRKEKGKENLEDEEEASLAKTNGKKKAKARKTIRIRMIRKIQRRKRLAHAIIVRKRVTLKRTAGRNIHTGCQRSSRRRRAPRLKKWEWQ